MSYFLSERAEEDVIGIAVFSIEYWGENRARAYVDDLYATFTLLGAHPNLGTRCDYICEGYRKFPKEQHLIIYRVQANEIEVVCILDGSMDVARQFSDDEG